MGACMSKLCACCHTDSKYGGDHPVDAHGVGGPSPFETRLQHEWLALDRDGNGALSLKEVSVLVRKLNCNIPKKELAARFAKYDVDGNKELSIEEFREFFKTVQSHPQELNELFERYRTPGGYMTIANLQRFLKENQQENVGLEVCTNLVRKLAQDALQSGVSEVEARDIENGVSIEMFTELLTSARYNSVLTPRVRKVNEKLLQAPLSHYFICSSHNTYLAGNQLTGASSINPIVRALRMGVRVVELDCYDGPTEPLIYHGGTLTSRLKFRDAVQAVKEHGFVTSKFPVIITLENHCSVRFQGMQASILREVLGDALFVPPAMPAQYDSPYNLRRKVLIRGKPKGAPPAPPVDEVAAAAAAAAATGAEEVKLDVAGVGAVDDDDDDEPEVLSPRSGGTTPKVKVHPDLLALMYIHNVKYKAAIRDPDAPHATSSSLNYTKLQKLSKPSPKAMIKHAQRNLLRVYPTGAHMDSSNYDPTLGWNRGAQLVALNYQTNDMPVWLSHGFFQDHGRCGYVPKPDFMLETDDAALTFDADKVATVQQRLTLTIISGHYLPKPNEAHKGEIIDPFVEVSVAGVPADCRAYTTHTIDNNGFNPRWESQYTFDVCCPELALLVFVVKDSDGVSSELIGQAVLPVSRLRAGHRIVPLLNTACAPLRDAFLFVRLTVANVGAKRRSTSTRRKSRTPRALAAAARADSGVQMTRNPMDSANSPVAGRDATPTRRTPRSPASGARRGGGGRARRAGSGGGGSRRQLST